METAAVTATGETTGTAVVTATGTATATATTADKYYHGGQVGVNVLPTSLDLGQVQVMCFQSMYVQ